jgi:hypothetical protein
MKLLKFSSKDNTKCRVDDLIERLYQEEVEYLPYIIQNLISYLHDCDDLYAEQCLARLTEAKLWAEKWCEGAGAETYEEDEEDEDDDPIPVPERVECKTQKSPL